MDNYFNNLEDLPTRIINGKKIISWKNSENTTLHFVYNNKPHSLKIVNYNNKNNITILFDNGATKKMSPTHLLKLRFGNIYKKEVIYKYHIGQIINNYQIIDCYLKEYSKNNSYTKRTYRCKCLIDGYEFEKYEYEITNQSGCPVCNHQVLLDGVNDISTTANWMTRYLYNKGDAHKYMKNSNKKIETKCPYCGSIKTMLISDLYRRGYSCSKCSDGISYPNKFAHELFKQLCNQYEYYEYEYSPKWANNYRYDNYIVLPNKEKIIVEMDGGFHYKNVNNNDDKKDKLAIENGIKIIRINCNYPSLVERFEYIKRNVIISLRSFFVMENIDWNMCNLMALSNKMKSVIDTYNENKNNFSIKEYSLKYGISETTITEYLKNGTKLGLCTYFSQYDIERIGNTKPVCMLDKQGNIIDYDKSVKNICLKHDLKEKVVRDVCRNYKKSYKGYIFKYLTKEEYLRLYDKSFKERIIEL